MAPEPKVTIRGDVLKLGPVRVTFQRTLRIPEQGMHDLPPGLGTFPLRRVEDYPATVPTEWLERGGVMLPVFQREAMWLSFDSNEPAALQVAIGKVCAISGEAWAENLATTPQNYAALPYQPWLDGINAGDGFIRQFVAVPLGLGATVEGQVTGEEVHGGVQLRVTGATAPVREEWNARPQVDFMLAGGPPMASLADAAFGLGAGGRMRQEIYADERALTDYDPERTWKVFVHLCSAAQWTAITGEAAPSTPVDRETYVRFGLPWFDYYDADKDDLAASEALAKVKPVDEVLKVDQEPFAPVDPVSVVKLKDDSGDAVEPGVW